MTLQRKLLLGFSLMVIPALLVGVQAIRTNALVRGTLQSLGERLARSRTYAEVEDAMFNQTQVIWRYLSGDPAAKKEFPLTEQVVTFWLDRWTAGLPPDELKLANGVRGIETDIRAVAGRVFRLHDAGRRDAAAVLARQELVERLQPALAEVNREIYRRAREFSVQAAFAQVAGIVEVERRVLWGIIALALAAGLLASWLISRRLARPLNELRHALAVVGAGDLDPAIEPRSSDERADAGGRRTLGVRRAVAPAPGPAGGDRSPDTPRNSGRPHAARAGVDRNHFQCAGCHVGPWTARDRGAVGERRGGRRWGLARDHRLRPGDSRRDSAQP